MGRTCSWAGEIELTPTGVKLNGSRRVRVEDFAEDAVRERLHPRPCHTDLLNVPCEQATKQGSIDSGRFQRSVSFCHSVRVLTPATARVRAASQSRRFRPVSQE